MFYKVNQIYKAQTILGIVILTSFMAISVESLAENVNKPSLEYVLKPTSQNLATGDTLYVDLFIKNNTDQKITICKWCNIKGKNYVSKIEGSNPLSYVDEFETTRTPEKTDLIVLEPLQEIILYDDMDYGPEYFPTSGTWLLKLDEEYLGVDEDPELKSWKGNVESNVIEIIVYDSSIRT